MPNTFDGVAGVDAPAFVERRWVRTLYREELLYVCRRG